MPFEENLIELMRNHEIIFNLKLKDYRNLDEKEKIWSEIAKTLNTTADVCKKKWKNRRDSYKKSKKQDLLSGSGALRKWKYFDQMRFLDKFESYRVTIGNIPQNADTSEGSDATDSSEIIMEEDYEINSNEEFKVLLESASQAIKAIVQSTVRSQSTTEAVFMTLARKIDENNLAPQVVNEIELHVISYVYEKIKENQK